jgi:hypothetical protein
MKLQMPHKLAINPIVGLSPLELELLLDQNLEQLTAPQPENAEPDDGQPAGEKGNYFNHSTFSDSCRSLRKSLSKERYLANPPISVKRDGEAYAAEYDSTIDQRIAEKLARFKRGEGTGTPSLDKIFSKKFAKDRVWIVEQQLAIVKYICERQDAYLKTYNPFDMIEIKKAELAEHIGHSTSTVYKLLTNLTIKLPDGRAIFAEDLAPNQKYTAIKGHHALNLLKNDPQLYHDGQWITSDRILADEIMRNFGLSLDRKTVQKYKSATEIETQQE